jgi:hypothetical protein
MLSGAMSTNSNVSPADTSKMIIGKEYLAVPQIFFFLFLE